MRKLFVPGILQTIEEQQESIRDSKGDARRRIFVVVFLSLQETRRASLSPWTHLQSLSLSDNFLLRT